MQQQTAGRASARAAPAAQPSGETAPETTLPIVADALPAALRALGVRQAFGVSGGAQALLWAGLTKALDVTHFRHEGGAAFAAAEAHFAGGRPVAVFVTTGPGITNALTGMIAARTEGAKVVLISAYSSAGHRGRGGIQETSGFTMPTSGLFEAGAWFDDAAVLETAEQLPTLLRRIATGLARPGGYTAHISVPSAIQAARLARPLPLPRMDDAARLVPATPEGAVAEAASALASAPFAIWAGFGARGAAEPLRALAERAGAPVMCSPRAKGVFPEDHPLFMGVTGMGGHADAVAASLRGRPPKRILVVGTRLGEPTSFWSPLFAPPEGFVHVDVDPRAFGTSYPDVPTLPILGEAGDALRALLARWPEGAAAGAPKVARPHPEPLEPRAEGPVRPDALMEAVQRLVVDETDAIVLAESGNSFTWATHHLRFREPGRYRVSTNLGSMGHASAGVVGAALAHRGGAVAILGDGAMLMSSEVSTAVKRGARAVWIVLNDGRYNMCFQGLAALDMAGAADAEFPPTDFAALARAQGAGAVRVEREADLGPALVTALGAAGPFVIDVVIDADRRAPAQGRNEGLRKGGAQGAATTAERKALSFPLTAAE